MNPDTTIHAMSFGNGDGLHISIEWKRTDPSSCSSVSDATWGSLLLHVHKTLIWGEPGESGFIRLERDWIDFLRHLCVAWPYLVHQQDYPEIFEFHRDQMPDHPGLFKARVEEIWREKGIGLPNQEDDDSPLPDQQEENALFDFLHLHDLTSGLPGTGVDPLVLLRQGETLLAGSKHQGWRLDWRRTMEILEKFGNSIASRVRHIPDKRLQDLLERWNSRDSLANSHFWELAANDEEGSLAGDALGTAGSPDEKHVPILAAAARMVGNTMNAGQKRHLFNQIRSIDVLNRGDNTKLNDIRRAVPTNLFENLSPREQGMALAQWLRQKNGVADHRDRVEPETILTGLNVDLVPLSTQSSVDAVAIWGQGLRPTILINPHGARACQATGRRFTLAHELAHLLMDVDREGDVLGGRELPDRAMETRANAFAAELILPENRVHETVSSVLDEWVSYRRIKAILDELKDRFGASYELSAWKIKHTKLLPEALELKYLNRHLNSIYRPY